MGGVLLMHLPIKEYNFYAAVDPGNKGAFAVINRAGTSFKTWDMPVTDGEYDLTGLRDIFKQLMKFPGVCLGIEWPHPTPGAFGNVVGDAEKFGRGKGYLEAFAFLLGLDYFKLAPHGWKQRLGVPGKTDPEAVQKCVALWDRLYPTATALVRGPRGGVKDGRLDACLMAHFLRDCRAIGDTARRHGKDSPELAAAVLGWGGTRKNHRLRIT